MVYCHHNQQYLKNLNYKLIKKMTKRDRAGKLSLTFPPFKKIICWIFIFIIPLPWLFISFKYDILNLIMKKVEELLMKSDKETLKKNGLFD